MDSGDAPHSLHAKEFAIELIENSLENGMTAFDPEWTRLSVHVSAKLSDTIVRNACHGRKKRNFDRPKQSTACFHGMVG